MYRSETIFHHPGPLGIRKPSSYQTLGRASTGTVRTQQFRNCGLVGAVEGEKRMEKMVVCGLWGAETYPGYFPRGV